MKKGKFVFVLFLLTAVFLSGCGSDSASGDTKHVKIGVTGSDGQYWQIIQERAKEEGIEVELVEFSDYTLPNNALINGEIDVNSFQHLAFLSQFIVENDDADIQPIGSTVVAPMGLYSEKYDHPDDIPGGATIAIPNDPANTGRGLKVLEEAGLITLKEDVGLYPTPDDIVDNPRNIEILTVVAQQTPRVLPDVAASIINSGIAGQAGYLLEDAIYHDDPHSEETRPYLNVFAVRGEDANDETYQTIARIYQEERVVEAVKEDSNGGNVVVDIPIAELQDTLDQLLADIKSGKQ